MSLTWTWSQCVYISKYMIHSLCIWFIYAWQNMNLSYKYIRVFTFHSIIRGIYMYVLIYTYCSNSLWCVYLFTYIVYRVLGLQSWSRFFFSKVFISLISSVFLLFWWKRAINVLICTIRVSSKNSITWNACQVIAKQLKTLWGV